MKKLIPFLFLVLLPAFLQAQTLPPGARHYLTTLGVSKADIAKVIKIQTQTMYQVREDQLELNLLKAELDKVLFPVNVDMKKVHQLLQESLQWKMKSELATIQERVELRKILGDYKYAEYRKFLVDTARGQRGKNGSKVRPGQAQ